MKKNKKLLIILLVVILVVSAGVILKVFFFKEEKTKTSFEDNKATSAIKLEEIEFKEITKIFENGITTIRANVYNNTKETKNINVKILLKDEKGKEIKSMIQALEQIEPGRKKVLQTGITGDYTQVKEVEFKIISNKELQQYN